jgi:signal transduction histidine kinase
MDPKEATARKDGAEARRLRDTHRVWILNGCLASVTAILFTTAVRGIGAPPAPFHIPWWVLAALFCVADILVVHMQFHRNSYSFSMSEVPLVLGLFYSKPSDIVLGQLVGLLVALIVHRRQSPMKLVFNLSHFALGTCTVALIYHAISAHGVPGGALSWVAAFVATAVAGLIADVMVGLAISLSEGRLQFHTSLQVLGMVMTGTVTNTCVALITAALLWHDRWAAMLMVIPATILALAYRSYTTQREKRESLEFLYDAMRIFNHSRDLDLGLAALLGATRDMFRAELAEIAFFPSSGQEGVLRTTVGPEDHLEGLHPVDSAGAEVSWIRAFSSENALLLRQPFKDEPMGQHFAARGIKDAMVAQLRGETRIIGVMLVANRLGDVSTFDTEDLRLFETLAGHTSVALENGRLEKSLAHVTKLQKERAWLLERAVQAAEDERTRLAAELHDGPIQRLTALAYGMERTRLRLGRGETEAGGQLLGSLLDQVGSEIRSLRRLMSELRPPILDERGLQAALIDYVDEFRHRTEIECQVMADIEARLDSSQETILYRLAQEALINVGKHSRASKASLSLEARNGSVELEVTDDGVGFDPSASPQARDHFGLAVMRERVEMAGGRWELVSCPGAGTIIRASLPRKGVRV